MNRMILLSSVLALGVSLGLPASAQATCYRVTSVGSETTTSTTQIRPGEGTAGSWIGACDTCNGTLGLPSVVNVSDESFQPYPTLIASAVAPLTQYGAT
ncbi:TPA: fimbrial protein, partial [Pseudomonas aeruginosa]|nr:fimbrial protein [Pseudomonas aeruginosa]